MFSAYDRFPCVGSSSVRVCLFVHIYSLTLRIFFQSPWIRLMIAYTIGYIFIEISRCHRWVRTLLIPSKIDSSLWPSRDYYLLLRKYLLILIPHAWRIPPIWWMVAWESRKLANFLVATRNTYGQEKVHCATLTDVPPRCCRIRNKTYFRSIFTVYTFSPQKC